MKKIFPKLNLDIDFDSTDPEYLMSAAKSCLEKLEQLTDSSKYVAPQDLLIGLACYLQNMAIYHQNNRIANCIKTTLDTGY